MDSMTQQYAADSGQVFYTQTSSTPTPTASSIAQNNRHVDTNDE